MEITEEHLKAVASYINGVKFSIKFSPGVPVARIWDCGCMGPLPECRCAKRERLVKEFLEEMEFGVSDETI